MAEFQGSESDVVRIRSLQKQRDKEREEFERTKKKLEEENGVGLWKIKEKFSSRTSEELQTEEEFKSKTVGLVTFDDFKKRRETLEKKEKVLEDTKQQNESLKIDTRTPKKPVKKINTPSKLSFNFDDEEELGEEEEKDIYKRKRSEDNSQRIVKPKKDQPDEVVKIKKNPFVDTTFLPDRDREEKEQKEREELKKKWIIEQETIKAQTIDITYSYYDGSGHRRVLNITKGTSVDKFLEMVRREFKELRGVPVDNLLFIKEDLIIPHHYTFYDLIVTKARGKSGPLFYWDVHDDVRMVNDATKEKEESHAAKVVERRWYDRNKHIFPASRWEVYDPTISRDKYTISDSLKEKEEKK